MTVVCDPEAAPGTDDKGRVDQTAHASDHSLVVQTAGDFTVHIHHTPGGDDVVPEAVVRQRHRAHLRTAGRGVDHSTDRGDYFTARTSALSALAEWLRAEVHDRRARVVTGSPGSGKSAVLGRLLLLCEADESVRRATPSEALPPTGMDIVPLHARRATLESLANHLAAVLGHPGADRDELLGVLADRTRPVVVLVDALDEAGTAGESTEGARIGRELLQPLTTMSSVRLIVGARAPLIPTAGHAVVVIDLDSPEHVRLDDIVDYAHTVLLDIHDADSRSPYRGNPEPARTVAEAIAARAGTSFLVARMTARALAQGQISVDTTQSGWRDRLPTDANQAFAAYLDRFGPQRSKVERLMRPLAYAQGAGLPWSTLWASLAEALSGIACPDEDLRWLHEHAGAYLVETVVDGEPVFRLFHETMAQHLRQPGRDGYAQHSITTALSGSVDTDPRTGRRQWSTAHRYVLLHLATHAAASGAVDTLIADTDYLVHASPDELLVALHGVTGDRGRLIRAVYRASAAAHRGLDPMRRRHVLATDAARFGARHLRRSLSQGLEWAPRWATGRQVDHALHATLAGSGRAMACTTVDGEPVAVVGGHDGVRVWNLRTGVLRRALTGHSASVDAIACSVIGGEPVAVTAGSDSTPRVWDLTTGALRSELVGHTAAVQAVLCAELDGEPVVVTAGDDDTAKVWDLATGRLRATLTGHSDSVRTLAHAVVDGVPVVITGSWDRTARVWDLATGALRATLPDDHPAARKGLSADDWILAYQDKVHGLACTEVDGHPVVITASEDEHARVWDLRTGKLLATLVGHDDLVKGVACAVIDGRPVAITTSWDTTAKVWDVATGALRATLTGHEDKVYDVACTTVDGRAVGVTAGFDGTARVWDLSTGELRATLTGHEQIVRAVETATVDGRPVVVSVASDSAKVWHLAKGLTSDVRPGHTHDINGVAATAVDGRSVVVTSSFDETARVWDLTTGELLHTYAGHTRSLAAVACAEVDGHSLAITTSFDGTAQVWDVATGEHRLTYTGHVNSVRAVTCTVVNGVTVAVTTGNDKTVQMWHPLTGAVHRIFRAVEAENGVDCAILTGGRHIFVTSYRRTATVWDAVTGRQLATLTGHDSYVTALASAEVGAEPVIVTTSHDGTARVWDLPTGRHRLTYSGHDAPVISVACTDIDGVSAAITADRHTVRIWDLANGGTLAEFDYTGRREQTLCLGPAGEIILASGWDLIVVGRTARPRC